MTKYKPTIERNRDTNNKGRMVIIETLNSLDRCSVACICMKWIDEIRKVILKCQDSIEIGDVILST